MAFAQGVGDVLAAFADLVQGAGLDPVLPQESRRAAGRFDVETEVVETTDQGQGLGLEAVGQVTNTVP